jgi:hypothetical protein
MAGCGATGDLSSAVPVATETKSPSAVEASPIASRVAAPAESPTSGDPSRLPLVQREDLTYLGAFASPENSGFTGRAISTAKDPVTVELRLYYRGHDQSSDQLAQISIPTTLSRSRQFADLPKSRFTQAWATVAEDTLDTHPSGVGDAGGNGAFTSTGCSRTGKS